MNKVRFRAINHKGKREYVYDPKGKYVLLGEEIVDESKQKKTDASLKRNISKLLKENPKIKSKVKGIKNLDKKLYYIQVWILTEAQDLKSLPNSNKRGFRGHHLDHIFPISESYKRGIPPECVADMTNLRFIHFRKNLNKGSTITVEGEKIMGKLI